MPTTPKRVSLCVHMSGVVPGTTAIRGGCGSVCPGNREVTGEGSEEEAPDREGHPSSPKQSSRVCVDGGGDSGRHGTNGPLVRVVERRDQ